MTSTRSCLALLLALAGCGSFPLGTVYPKNGQSVRDRDADMLYCKDWAKTETETNTRVAASFLAGLTLIGIPFAIKSEKTRTRELFAQCMSERGYTVTPPQ